MFPGGDWEGQDWDTPASLGLNTFRPWTEAEISRTVTPGEGFLSSQPRSSNFSFCKSNFKGNPAELSRRSWLSAGETVYGILLCLRPCKSHIRLPQDKLFYKTFPKCLQCDVWLPELIDDPSGSFPSMQDISENRSNEFLVGIFFPLWSVWGLANWKLFESLHWLASLYFKF